MLSELPNLIDRNFAIGFFLPAVFLVAALALLYWLSGNPSFDATAIIQGGVCKLDGAAEFLVGLAVIIPIWLLAVALVAVNHPILRIMEGYAWLWLVEQYGRLHPRGRRWLERRRQQRFKREVQPALELQGRIAAARAAGGAEPPMPVDLPRRRAQAALLYPDAGAFVLPTRFGNIFRAFEVYPRVIYGLDAIPAWPRLYAVMPEKTKHTLASAKAQMNFCVNIFVIAVVCLIVFAGMSLRAGWTWLHANAAPQHLDWAWVPLLLLPIAVITYQLALIAAMHYGNHVKSAFDLYRDDLARALGLQLPRCIDDERTMWRTASRMMIYRSAARAAALARFRRPVEEQPAASGGSDGISKAR
jgi:hypothetical protein